MNSLQETKKQYPEAVKAKPKGWKFIYGTSLIKKGDKIWNRGIGPFVPVDNNLHGKPAKVYNPIIREIKVAPKPPKVADGLVIPSGHVYIGLGKECHPSWRVGGAEYFDFIYFSKFWKGWRNLYGHCSNSVEYHIAAEFDSPLHKAQPWYRPKNIKDQLVDANNKVEELTKELGKQKDELEKYKSFYDKVKGIGL